MKNHHKAIQTAKDFGLLAYVNDAGQLIITKRSKAPVIRFNTDGTVGFIAPGYSGQAEDIMTAVSEVIRDESTNKHLSWLVENAPDIRIIGVENKLGMPKGTLKNYVGNNKHLPEVWHPAVINWVINHVKV